jgi:alkylresorcinol/alkylpyrone synthase
MDRLHASSRVTSRHLVMPLDWYRQPKSFTATNDTFVGLAVDLAEEALVKALAVTDSGLMIGYIVFTSVTGISALQWMLCLP